jgi:hypothetical protein
MFAKMYKVAKENPSEIKDEHGMLNRFYDGEMRLDPDKSVSAIDVCDFLAQNKDVMTQGQVIASQEGLQPWSHGLPHGDIDFLRQSTAILHRFDNSLGRGITYGIAVNE